MPGVFTYASQPDGTHVDWHMNFADTDLFVAYGSPLLAQDELQVLEHPILGSLRVALAARGQPPETTDGKLRPTPVTITGAASGDAARSAATGP